MNISSVVISVRDGADLQNILKELGELTGCEIVAHEKDKIVAVLTAENVDEEVRLFRQIEAIDGVIAAAMVYAYQEDVEFDRDKLEIKNELSEILTNDDIRAEDIVYNGHVNHRTK